MNRREFLAAGASALTALACKAHDKAADRATAREKTFSFDGKVVRIPFPGVEKTLNALVVGDTHFALHDERDNAYAGCYKRMAAYKTQKEPFQKMLAQAKADKIDLLMLVGDIISFPTLANVEFVKSQLDACGLPWMYTAGNHDWHFEGLPGKDLALRGDWIAKRLLPFYQGENPLMYSRMVNGVRIVAIDNSAYHILPEQVAFWKTEAAKGAPTVLMMHIPFWHEGWDVTTCACPAWGAAADPYHEIERRELWAKKLTPATFEFRRAVFSTPNLAGIFTGHEHALQFAHAEGQNCFGVPAGRKGAHLAVKILPAASHASIDARTGQRHFSNT